MICSQRPASCFLHQLLRSPFHVCPTRLLALSNRFLVSLAATASLSHWEWGRGWKWGRGFRMFVLFSSIITAAINVVVHILLHVQLFLWGHFPKSISRPKCMPI